MSGQLSKIAPGPSSLGTPDLNSKQLWDAIGDQYHRATGGMREVLKFGCMMLVLEAHLENVSNSDTLPAKRGRDSKGGGLKGLLEKNRPDIKRPTAYRFRDVAKAVQTACGLPGKATKRLTFEQIVTADPKTLSDVEKKAQTGLFAFVDGTSQKSLLDDYKEAGNRGGDTSGSTKKKTPAQLHKEFLANTHSEFMSACQTLDRYADKDLIIIESITDPEREHAADLFTRLAKRARAWNKVPKKDRTHAAAAVEEEAAE